MSIVDTKHACAFTGHRPERLEAPEEEVKKWLEEKLRKAVNDGYTDFITGMQRGVDLWAAEILMKLKREGINMTIKQLIAILGSIVALITSVEFLALRMRKYIKSTMKEEIEPLKIMFSISSVLSLSTTNKAFLLAFELLVPVKTILLIIPLYTSLLVIFFKISIESVIYTP